MDRVPVDALARAVAKNVRPDLLPGHPADWEEFLNAALDDTDDDKLVQKVFPPWSPQDIGIH